MQTKSAMTTPLLLAGLFIGLVIPGTPVSAADESGYQKGKGRPDCKQEFEKLDKDRNGYLSMDEFKASGKDDLAFKAADVNGDGRLDLDEYIAYCKARAAKQGMQK